MSARLARGVLTISIDLDVESEAASVPTQRLLDQATERLLELLGQYQVPATWAVADPAGSPATERIVATRGGHEIAIAGGASWAGREAGRGRFGPELARRVVRARGADLAIGSLVVKSVELDDQYDLVVKQGLTAVRQGAAALGARARRRLQPLAPRFGLWSFPVSAALPGTSRLWPGGGGGRAARAAIDLAIREHAPVCVAIDVVALVERGQAAERIVERVLQHAQARHRQGLLEIATLMATAKKLTGQCTSKPSRSILRPAA